MTMKQGTQQPYSESTTLDAAIKDHLGVQLRALYAAFTNEVLPQTLLDLIARFEHASSDQEHNAVADFSGGLIAALPALRAFAMSLAQSGQADDLVQETLLKAWQNQGRFVPGTNLNAWLFTILRNQFYTQYRKRRREVEDRDGDAAGQLITLPNQEHRATLSKVAAALQKLPPNQREALILVGAQGLTYEAAAEVMGCQTGTVKSRVSRSRAMLSDVLKMKELPIEEIR